MMTYAANKDVARGWIHRWKFGSTLNPGHLVRMKPRYGEDNKVDRLPYEQEESRSHVATEKDEEFDYTH
jgi:hypothetical protein